MARTIVFTFRARPGARVLLVAAFALLIAGCESRIDSPVAPSATDSAASATIVPDATRASPVLASRGSGRIGICHRTEGANPFIPLAVAPSALDAHLAHGDGRIGHGVPGRPGTKFGSDCAPVPLVAVTITFSALSGSPNLSPFTTHVDSGFSVSPASGSWVVLTTYGNPAPAIIFTRLASEPTIAAGVQIAAGGDPFVFTSVDLYSSITPIPYVISGFLDSALVFTASAFEPNTFGNFVTVPNPYATATIDALSITLSNPATPCCPNPAGLDNIALAR